MGNIIDYVYEYGNYTFSEMPLNEVDSLVLCQLIYLNYENYVPGLEKRNAPVSIQQIYADENWRQILEGYWFKEDNAALFIAAAESVRFGSLKMNYYINIVSEKEEAQFSAMTYVLEDKNCYLAYRGTDATFIGWKEDFNMAYSKPVHSHHLSVEYMDRVAGYIGGDFYAGGHSKGGNLAVYAAMNCQEITRHSLLAVYNNDGPGFRPEILSAGNYKAIEGCTFKFIPKSSIVGVLLESEGEYDVVESRSIGALQHNSYSWKVKDAAFVRAGSRTDFNKFRDAALNEWILSLSEEETHAFVDTVYEVISASDAKDIFALGADWKKALQSMSGALKGLTEETRNAISGIIRSGFDIAGSMAVAEVKNRQQDARERQQERKQEIRERKEQVKQEMKDRQEELVQKIKEKQEEVKSEIKGWKEEQQKNLKSEKKIVDRKQEKR